MKLRLSRISGNRLGKGFSKNYGLAQKQSMVSKDNH